MNAPSEIAPQAPVDYLSLTQAAKFAPGRPSANCVWRWCRRGVLARSGERVRLQHLRVGGKVYTSVRWVEEFGRRLAEADTTYFEGKEDAGKRLPPRDPQYDAPKRKRRVVTAESCDRDNESEIERELEEEGI